MKIQRLGEITTQLGECPQWHGHHLWMLDCRAGSVLALDPDSGQVVQCTEVPPPLGSFAFNHDGALVLATKEHVLAVHPVTGRQQVLADLGCSLPHLRFNDGAAMPDGSFVVGTMHLFREPGEAPAGGLFRLDTALQWRRLDQGYGITNGPCVSPVNGRLHVADSEARLIHAYAIHADGGLGDKQVFADTQSLGSSPDGCCFDDQGGLWTALVRAGALARFDVAGHLTHCFELPVAHPSALCFGGPDLEDVFVTSIRDSGRLKAQGPLDGGVLKISGLGYRGLASHTCRLPLCWTGSAEP